MIIDGAAGALPSSDICIVGAGPVGLSLAFRCAERGLSVAIVEAGSADGSGGDIAPGPVSFTNGHHVESALSVASGIGGTSRLWGGRCVALDPLDFGRRGHVPMSGWPIPADALQPYYPDALNFLGCDPRASVMKSRAEGDVRMDSLEHWAPEPDLGGRYRERLVAAAGITVITNARVSAMMVSGDGDIEGLELLTSEGRRDLQAGRYALAAGGLENTRLLLAAQEQHPEKFGGREGPLGRFYAGHLTGYLSVIEFNNVETEDLLWFRKASGGDIVRQRLMIDPPVQAANGLLNAAYWLESLSIADPSHGSGALSLVYLIFALTGLYPRIARGLAPATSITPQRLYRAHWRNIRNDVAVIPGAARTLFDMLLRRFRRAAGAVRNPRRRYLLRYHAEQAPNAESIVRLRTQGEGKAAGLEIDLRFGMQDFDSIVRSHEIIDRWLRREKLGHLDYIHRCDERHDAVRDQALDGYHQIGSTRMSDDPGSGVVNADCRVHDVGNLYVAGSSVFPTGGQANPTLPAIALALRLADHLASLASDETPPSERKVEETVSS